MEKPDGGEGAGDGEDAASGATWSGDHLLRLRAFERRRGAGGRARWLLEAEGEIDLATFRRLEEILFRTCEAAAAADGGPSAAPPPLPCVVADFRRVGFIDSAGLALLVRARAHFADRCEVALVVSEGGNPDRALRLAFRLAGPNRAFRIAHALEEIDRELDREASGDTGFGQ